MKTLRVLFLALLSASCAHADPTISSVTGTITRGQSVVVSGAGYETKSPAAPLRWAPFDTTSNASTLGQATNWSQIQTLTWDSDDGYGSSGGMKANAIAGNGVLGTLRVDSSAPAYNATSQKWYSFHREYNNFIAYNHATPSTDDHNMKRLRLWPAGGSGAFNFVTGDYDGRVFVENAGCTGQDSGYWTSKPITNRTGWIAKERFFKASSGSCVKDGTFRERFDGVDRHSGSIITQKVSPSVSLQSLYVVHSVGANVGSSWTDPAWTSALEFRADDVYLDLTWQRVMICEASTFENCRKFGFIVPTAWSATSITGTLQFHSQDFPAQTTAYVYVFDTTNTPNTTGKSIVIGGSVAGDPAPTITSVNISTGSYLGGTVSTATGTGFTATPTVLVGTVSATSVVLNSATSIRFTIPAAQAGQTGLDLKITNPDAQFAVLTATMSYDSPVANQAPYNVSAGDNWAVTLPSGVNLSGTAEDDGLPAPPATLTYLWAKESGPGTITFGTATALTTTATFSVEGTYTVSITASDSSLSTESDHVTIVVSPVVVVTSPGGAFPWKAP